MCLALVAPPADGLAATIRDDAGRTIRLDRPATRIIALYGAFNEILAAMGLEDRIVARTEADDQPPSILAKPSVGTHMRPNLELAVGLKPDLALQLAGRGAAGETAAALERHGVPTAVFEIGTLEDLYSVIERLGQVTGAEDRAATLVADLRGRLGRVASAVAGAPRPSVFFEARYPNLLAAGGRSIVSDVIRAAGGRNCVENPEKLVRLSEEELLRLNPDVYLLQRGAMNPDPSDPARRPHFQTLKAVREGRTLVVDEQLFSRPGPRVALAVETLAALLHPDLYPAGPPRDRAGEAKP